jgi:hypothetical protein
MRAIIALVSFFFLVQGAVAENTRLSVADQLAAAVKERQTVFLLVTEPSARKVAEMRAVAVEAQRRTPGSRLVELDRSRRENRPIVKRYGVLGARLPLVLILAHNGAPAGGAALKAGALERLLGLVPTPRKAETLLALFERKAVFVIVARPGMTEEAAVVMACRDASRALKGVGTKEKAAIVRVNLDDKAEKAYLELLGADPKATHVVTHVYGLSGVKTGVLKGTPTPEALVEAAGKKKECCPGGKCG